MHRGININQYTKNKCLINNCYDIYKTFILFLRFVLNLFFRIWFNFISYIIGDIANWLSDKTEWKKKATPYRNNSR